MAEQPVTYNARVRVAEHEGGRITVTMFVEGTDGTHRPFTLTADDAENFATALEAVLPTLTHTDEKGRTYREWLLENVPPPPTD